MDSSASQPDREAQQELARALGELHRAAGRLSYRRVSKLVDEGGYSATVSYESVRTTLQVLRGVPRWETVEAIVSVLAPACRPPRDPAQELARFLPLWRALREGESGRLKSARELALSEGWGGEDGKWTPEAVAGVLINPVSAIQIDPSLVKRHEPLVSEEQWVQVGMRVIEESGAEFFLRALLKVLKGDYVGTESGAPFGYSDPSYERDEAYEAFQYSSEQILRRLRAEPNLLQRSIAAMRADATLSSEERAEMLRVESDLSLMREVMMVTPETWDEISEEAHLAVFMYLVREGKTVGRPSLPPAQRYQITWRVPESTES